MIKLPKGCYCGELTVYPKNYQDTDASLQVNWRISYRFYDPLYKTEFPKGRQRLVQGMNKFKDYESRLQVTQQLLANELHLLRNGYNPITKKSLAPVISFSGYRKMQSNQLGNGKSQSEAK